MNRKLGSVRSWQQLVLVIHCRRWRHAHVRKQLAVVSALVGAGGNLGAVTPGGRHSCNGTDEGLLMRRLIPRDRSFCSHMRPSLSLNRIDPSSLPCRTASPQITRPIRLDQDDQEYRVSRIAGFCFYKPIQDALLPFQAGSKFKTDVRLGVWGCSRVAGKC